jgi:peptidoglycan/LPS O-acetylase OafA/YrhL
MQREKRASMYMAAAHMGAIGTPLLLAALFLGWPDFVHGFAIGILLVSLSLLLWRRLRDEYIEQLWNAGTSWAFAAIVLCFLFLPFYQEMGAGRAPLVPQTDFPPDWAGIAAITAFFVGFHIKWLRSRA